MKTIACIALALCLLFSTDFTSAKKAVAPKATITKKQPKIIAFSCSVPKNVCSKMKSCEEAKFHFNTSGPKPLPSGSKASKKQRNFNKPPNIGLKPR